MNTDSTPAVVTELEPVAADPAPTASAEPSIKDLVLLLLGKLMALRTKYAAHAASGPNAEALAVAANHADATAVAKAHGEEDVEAVKTQAAIAATPLVVPAPVVSYPGINTFTAPTSTGTEQQAAIDAIKADLEAREAKLHAEPAPVVPVEPEPVIVDETPVVDETAPIVTEPAPEVAHA